MIRSKRALTGLTFVAAALAFPCSAASTYDGSLSVTSDYLVRGISRSDDQAAAQAEAHYLHSSGLVAGVAASTVRFRPRASSEIELNGFVGFAWRAGDEWQGKLIAGHYVYPWLRGNVDYDYDEVTADVAYAGWLDLSMSYSPNYRRVVPYRGLVGTRDVAADLNVDIPLQWHVALIGGVGYSRFGGPGAEGYVYGSAGLGADWERWSLSVSYIETSYDAKSLFYQAAAGARWVGTVVWKFR